jgi:hypothetical protein
MAFSFSPGQIAPQGSQAITPPGTVAPGTAVAPVVGPPSDSPILFIRERGGPISIMACVQIVLILVTILSIIICVTLYGYSVYLSSQIESKKAEILSNDATFPVYPYEEMTRLTKRMTALDKLLQAYVSPRSPLKFLENVVENKVVFDKFSLSKDLGGNYVITFATLTNDYKTLIQQLAAINLQEYSQVISTPKISGINDVNDQDIKVQVTTPVFVQGKLADQIVFLPVDTTKNSTSSSQAASSSRPK